MCGLVGLAHAASAKTAARKESDLTVCLIVKREELQKCREVPRIIYFINFSPPEQANITEKGEKKPEKIECVHYTDIKMVNIVIAVKSQLTTHLVQTKIEKMLQWREMIIIFRHSPAGGVSHQRLGQMKTVQYSKNRNISASRGSECSPRQSYGMYGHNQSAGCPAGQGLDRQTGGTEGTVPLQSLWDWTLPPTVGIRAACDPCCCWTLQLKWK